MVDTTNICSSAAVPFAGLEKNHPESPTQKTGIGFTADSAPG
jgi:hypothetical protein